MKKTFLLAAAFAALLALPARAASFGEDEFQALGHAILDADGIETFRALPDQKTVAVLPIQGDREGAVLDLVKKALVQSGKKAVEGKEDPMWDELIREMAFDQRKAEAGILDEKTIDRIGSLKAANMVVYGRVVECSKNENRIYVLVSLNATEVATKRIVWSGLFNTRWYVPGTDVPKGISGLGLPIRNQLKNRTTKMLVESLRAQPMLEQAKSVVLTPLAGDEDRYCTYILRDGITQSSIQAKELDLDSLKGARTTFHDLPPEDGDAVVYGAVRQLGYTTEPGWKDFWTLYKVDLDFQAAIERTDTHVVLWSDTIQSYVHLYDLNWGKILLFGIPILLVVFLFLAFLRKTSRVR